MSDITPDICDHFAESVTLLNLPLRRFGGRGAFWGEIVTIRCYQDNSRVKEMLAQEGHGKVLIVDGNGSTQRALLGDMLAQSGIDNGWAGVIVYGAIRDVAQLATMDFGVLALATNPFKSDKRDQGEVNVTLTLQNQLVQPNHYVYADENGVLICNEALNLAQHGIKLPSYARSMS
ncbi:putative 4-hydroxy-4-methyl-2-oxoglutarate aldolase [Vibrio sp. SM6]|uniref:4-hydroxy-4-methyl-2-oxoglutarate aldolase n=1 Tax=Vibrio agarilyticus TaxID=2726741 RepID=A0A7X8TPC2_9VIBR|nr:putative 4-hydroxy-4-methyl-2-oxoglutarate aldolase [Vibrio agarilyticus]NLS12270.1 putative 4-hydroxy-4-methyl-2-oxoglutarate aldolase [Vibrio agarilyticus]